MTTSNELMMAILSMDSYNRGYDRGITTFNALINVTKIGNATIIATTRDDNSLARITDFYATAYEYNGVKIISYRGTNGINDPVYGWPLGGGAYLAAQGNQAIQFFKDVAGSGANLQTTNIVLTGHSLGGGLAGYVAALYGKAAYVYDSMGYITAANNAHDAALNIVYNGNTPWAVNDSGVKSWQIEGQALDSSFITIPSKTNYDLGNSTTLGPVDKHSMALLVMRLFAENLSDANWKTSAQYFMPLLYDDQFASKIGNYANQVGPLLTAGDYSGILRTMLAYSALDTTTKDSTPFGNTAIRAFYNDANDLGKSVGIVGEKYEPILSKILIDYAGKLALNQKIVTDLANDPIIQGALKYSDGSSNNTLTISFDDTLWKQTNDAGISHSIH